MAKISLQYDVTNNTPASAVPVEANFNRIEDHINQEVIERGGSVAMTGQLRLAGDPIASLDAAPKSYVDQFMPVGSITMYGGTAAPAGGQWKICDGTELQAAEYPVLYAIIGIAYGGGSGRFKLPDLRSRFPMGGTPGATGGKADAPVVTHTHTINHDHPVATSSWPNVNHSHGINLNTGVESAPHTHTTQTLDPGPASFQSGSGASWSHYSVVQKTSTSENVNHVHGVSGATGIESANHTHTVDVAAYSGSTAAPTGSIPAAGANLPPYTGVNYIIKVV